MRFRGLLVAFLAAFVTASPAAQPQVETCAPTRVDIADWPIVRSARVPGFTLRLPRVFAPDMGESAETGAAGWTDAARNRFALLRPSNGQEAITLPSAEGRASYRRCEVRVGSALADIVSFAETKSAGRAAPAPSVVVLARIRWPDGEELVVSASGTGEIQLDQLLAAVRTIRRAGA